ncbi:MAG: hypothetical protein QOF51_1306 [Chloroflexota bacterium]|jgi:diguanylate cyclase (GGDEF)-like protein|nr:hypothetical protein [Chloroflexota bacterium]
MCPARPEADKHTQMIISPSDLKPRVSLRQRLIALTLLASIPALFIALTQLPAIRRDDGFALSESTLACTALLAMFAALGLSELLVVRRINRLAGVARRLSAGDLSERAPETGGDAIAATGVAFNHMAEQIQQMLEMERRVRTSLEQQVGALVAQRTERLLLLAEISRLLESCQSTSEILTMLARQASRCFPGTSGALYLMRAGAAELEVSATWGEEQPAQDAIFQIDDCRALRTGRTSVLDGGEPFAPCAHLPEPIPSAALCVPLIAYGELLGLLHVASGTASGIASAHEWVQNQQAIARILANTVAVALANVKLREALRQQSIRDPLTGLFNRRYMEETLVRELRRAQRTGQEVTVLLLDIDHFKHFNDTFGHPAGDELLKGVSAALQSGVRAEDVVCRFGGEEFVIILFGAGCDVGQMRAEGFRECIKRLDVRYQGAALGTVSVSIGIAGFPTDGSESGSLIDAADRALYHAKAGGRDRVELARDAERTTVETALIAGE